MRHGYNLVKLAVVYQQQRAFKRSASAVIRSERGKERNGNNSRLLYGFRDTYTHTPTYQHAHGQIYPILYDSRSAGDSFLRTGSVVCCTAADSTHLRPSPFLRNCGAFQPVDLPDRSDKPRCLSNRIRYHVSPLSLTGQIDIQVEMQRVCNACIVLYSVYVLREKRK